MTPTPDAPFTSATANDSVNGSPLPVLDPALIPNLDDLVTEDHAPVDRIYVEKQSRLLTEPLYSSWTPPGEERSFLMLVNVGWFHTVGQPPLVPDGLLSLDVAPAGDLHSKAGHSYFQWLMGKSPEVVLEIVSDKRGDEEGFKMISYARLGVLFYVIFDPENLLGGGELRIHVLQRGRYVRLESHWFPEVGLGLTLWEGLFEGQHQVWLRWCHQDGRVIPTGAERADRADQKLQKLAAQLRALGIEPEV